MIIDLEPFTKKKVKAVSENFAGTLISPAKDMVTQYQLTIFFQGLPPVGSERMDLEAAIELEKKFLEVLNG
jgi:hypothetical protein